jgi:hypothetical protein
MNDEKKPFFSEDDLIFAYTRKQALEDGVLIDVTETAKEAGFRYPVAVTAALWADINAIPKSKQSWQDVQGRLWDVLCMGRCATLHSKKSGSTLLYTLIMHVGRDTYYTVRLVCGPGDEGEPVVTLMRPDED